MKRTGLWIGRFLLRTLHAAFASLNAFIERWLRHRFALPLAVSLAVALLVLSEHAYHETSSLTLRAIELSDARIQSVRLLQWLTDAEAAHHGYLLTGEAPYLARHADARVELAQVQLAITTYFASQGAAGAAAVHRLVQLSERELARLDRTLAMAQAGHRAEAAALSRSDQSDTGLQTLRSEVSEQLMHTHQLLQRARDDMHDELRVNRWGIGLLTLGTLCLMFLFVRQLGRYDHERGVQQSALLAERARLEVEVTRRTERLATLAKHLQTAREDERASLARELHDELGSLLTASKFDIARARKKADEPAELLASLERINDHLSQGIALKRRIIEGLRPSALSNLGLTAALDVLCRDMSASLALPVRLLAAEFALAPESSLAVYRFVQEALTNIGKYANASHVEVEFAMVDGKATVQVRDDGVGFVVQESYAGHHGLAGMQFRAETLGGTMQVTSQPGHGTTVRIVFPPGSL